METATKEKLIIMLDASAFKESSCIRRFINNTVYGYTSKVNSNDIEFGTAFHKFKSNFRMFGPDEGFQIGMTEAVEHFNLTPMYVKPKKAYLDVNFLSKACVGYATKYRKDNFGIVTVNDGAGNETPLIEPNTRFMFPYYTDDLMEILMAGTIDELGRWKDGIYCIADLKTSSVWNIEEYFRSYQLSPQLLFYRWAIGKYAEEYPDSIFGEIISQHQIGQFIDGVFFAGKDKDIQYQRSPVKIIGDKELAEFDNLVKIKVNQLIAEVHRIHETSLVPLKEGMLNGACNTVYGLCKFFGACSAPDDETYKIILETKYTQKQYNPLHHGI